MASSLTADFLGANGAGNSCVLILQPDNELHSGPRLEALVRAAKRNYWFVHAVLDDVSCALTEKESAAFARTWLEENREDLEDWGLSLERLRVLSEASYAPTLLAEMNEACRRNPFLASLIDEKGEGTEDAPQILRRIAGYMAMAMDYSLPVVGAERVDLNAAVFKKLSESTKILSLFSMPEMVDVAFREKAPEAAPVRDAQAPEADNIIKLFPRK